MFCSKPFLTGYWKLPKQMWWSGISTNHKNYDTLLYTNPSASISTPMSPILFWEGYFLALIESIDRFASFSAHRSPFSTVYGAEFFMQSSTLKAFDAPVLYRRSRVDLDPTLDTRQNSHHVPTYSFNASWRPVTGISRKCNFSQISFKERLTTDFLF